MKTNGISENDIQRINSKSNIMSYETVDICLNRVFDELWIINGEVVELVSLGIPSLNLLPYPPIDPFFPARTCEE